MKHCMMRVRKTKSSSVEGARSCKTRIGTRFGAEKESGTVVVLVGEC